MKRCKRCGKKFATDKMNRVFCDFRCQTRHNAIKRYYKLRHKKWYKAVQKKNWKHGWNSIPLKFSGMN